MVDPRNIGVSPVRDLPSLLEFANRLWLPDYRLLKRKLAAMLGSPGAFSVPLWDGESWHAAQVGSSVLDLPDADGLVDPALGTVYVAREGSLSADRAYMPVAGGNYDSLTFWNLTTTRTITLALGAGDMVLPPMYTGRLRGDPAAFVGLYREPVTFNPELFG